MGQAVFGNWLSEPEDKTGDRINRSDILRLATVGEIDLAGKFRERSFETRLHAHLIAREEQTKRLMEEWNMGKLKTKDALADALVQVLRNSGFLSHYLFSNWGAVAVNMAKKRMMDEQSKQTEQAEVSKEVSQ
jgi:hypothetical protein